MHIHEIIITRGNVRMMSDYVREIIMRPENCGFVMAECHQYVEGGVGRIFAISHLIKYEGHTRIMRFIREMSQYMDVKEFASDIELGLEALKSGAAWATVRQL